MLSLIHAVAGRPWAIRAEIALHIRGLLAHEGIAALRHLAALKADIHAERPQAAVAVRGGSVGSVAVIPIIGMITQRAQGLESAETRSTAQIAREVRAAAMDSAVDAVMLEIDSPGGEVFGVPEAWASIRESARMKPVLAFANSVAASAALYLASAADEFWVTPSGEVGSVGVYALHVDQSKAIEAAGESWDFIVADKSPFKIEGNPAGPLSDEARAHAQRDVNRYMGMFVRDLAKGRRVTEKQVEADFGGGRMLSPGEAVKVGMADQVGTFDLAARRAVQLVDQRRVGGQRAAAADHHELAIRAALAGVKLKA